MVTEVPPKLADRGVGQEAGPEPLRIVTHSISRFPPDRRRALNVRWYLYVGRGINASVAHPVFFKSHG